MNRSWCLSEQQFATQTIHTDLRRTFFQLTILSRRFVTETAQNSDQWIGCSLEQKLEECTLLWHMARSLVIKSDVFTSTST